MKNTIKSLFVILLSGILCLGLLSGCGKEEPKEKKKETAVPEATKEADNEEKEEKESKKEKEEEEEEEPEMYSMSTYFDNDLLEVTLDLYDDYSIIMTDTVYEYTGTYYFEDDYFYLEFDDGDTYEGHLDEDGDLYLDGVEGYFYEVEEGSYYPTESEEQAAMGYTVPDFEIPDGNKSYDYASDTTTRYSDYDGELAATYPDWMVNYEDTIYYGSSLFYDGEGGYVFLENVTDEYMDYEGSNEAYLSDYLNDDILYIFEQLYGGNIEDSTLTILEPENGLNNIVTAEANVYNDVYDMQLKITLGYGCQGDVTDDSVYMKIVFADYFNDKQLDVLSSSVVDISQP